MIDVVYVEENNAPRKLVECRERYEQSAINALGWDPGLAEVYIYVSVQTEG